MKRIPKHDCIGTVYDGDQYELLIYCPKSGTLYYEDELDEDFVKECLQDGDLDEVHYVKNETFEYLYDNLTRKGCQSGYFYDIHAPRHKKPHQDLIAEDVICRAIRGELSADELSAIVQKYPACADYYDFDALISVINAFKRGEIDENYFTDWLIVTSWAFNEVSSIKSEKKRKLYYDLSYCLDGYSFVNFERNKDAELRELLSDLKFFHHRICHTAKATLPPFYNEGNVQVFLCFDYCNHANEFHRVCVVDDNKQEFRIAQIVNPDYLENVNYTPLDPDEFENLSSKYYDYYCNPYFDLSPWIASHPIEPRTK